MAAILSRPQCVKQLEMHESVLSTEATDTLVLKHQAISFHTADCW